MCYPPYHKKLVITQSNRAFFPFQLACLSEWQFLFVPLSHQHVTVEQNQKQKSGRCQIIPSTCTRRETRGVTATPLYKAKA